MKEKYVAAGKIAAECLDYGSKLIKVNANIREVLDAVEVKIAELGAKPAFPAQLSINSAAAHQCAGFDESTLLCEGDVAKLDVGVHVDGFIGDNAVTVDLGSNAELVKASREALNNACRIVAPGTTLGDIGKVIEDTIQSFGFKPVRNLSGHGLGEFDVHTKPTVPNFANNDKFELTEGMVIAIEPFATNGDGLIHEKGKATVFEQISDKGTRNPVARNILKDIHGFQGLPFAQRWLARKHGLNRTNYGLTQLLRVGIVRSHPPLVEIKNGLVSQAEHSIFVDEKSIILTSK